MDTQPVVSLQNASKNFGAYSALKNVSLDLYPGEVHVLLGENGAGKSTLVKTLIGAHQADEGKLFIRQRQVEHHSPANARREGINAVLQDFSLAPTMNVVDNIFLGREETLAGFIRRSPMRKRAEELMEMVGGKIPLDVQIGALPRSEQQLVEIMKAIMGTPGVLLLDEPTAALSDNESEHLFEVVERLRSENWSILYITHRMNEIRRVGTRVTVIREGRTISSHLVGDVEHFRLIEDMVGRDVSAVFPSKADPGSLGDELLSLDDVHSVDGKVRGVSLRVQSGEIVGIAGLVGSGKGEVARVLFGLLEMSGGTVSVLGVKLTRPTARRLLDIGVGFMPEDRKRESLALERTVEENITMESIYAKSNSRFGFLRKSMLARMCEQLVQRLDIRPRAASRRVSDLSGGNQQKVVLARALTKERKLFVVSEPTAGVDIGSRQQIYAEMRSQCQKGAGVLVVSSDLEEVIGISDRIYVMNGGKVHAELAGREISNEAVIAGAFGHAMSPQERG